MIYRVFYGPYLILTMVHKHSHPVVHISPRLAVGEPAGTGKHMWHVWASCGVVSLWLW